MKRSGSSSAEHERIENPYLCFGSEKNPIKELAEGENPTAGGVPFLPPFYSYLLKVSSNVGVVETYPWLAELIFHSSAAPYQELLKEAAGQGQAKRYPLNVITITIDESMHTIADVMIPLKTPFLLSDRYPGSNDQTGNYIRHIMANDGFMSLQAPEKLHSPKPTSDEIYTLGPVPMPRIFQVDTLGEFGDLSNERPYSVMDHNFSVPLYNRSTVVGSGNPMRLLQRFMALGAYTEISARGRGLDADPSSHDTPLKNGRALDLGPLNCIVVNSISNLARRMGFRDAMHLVRAMIERAVWGLGERQHGLFNRPGMLFALVSEDVFKTDEIRYAETFFDGIIRFDAMEYDRSPDNTIFYEFERFPLVEAPAFEIGQSEDRKRTNDARAKDWRSWFSPNFAMRYRYLPLAGTRMRPERIERLDPERSKKQFSEYGPESQPNSTSGTEAVRTGQKSPRSTSPKTAR